MKYPYLSPVAQSLELAAETFVCQSPPTKFILTFGCLDSDEDEW